jgi:hypothetical protein
MKRFALLAALALFLLTQVWPSCKFPRLTAVSVAINAILPGAYHAKIFQNTV